MTLEALIPLSIYGQFDWEYSLVENGGNRMAFDGDHLLYCFTNSFEIKVIDLDANTVTDGCSLDEFEPRSSFDNIILKYSPYHTKLFLIVQMGSTDCFIFDTNNLSDYDHVDLPEKIRDFEISNTQEHIFVSSISYNPTTYFFSVFDFNFTLVSSITRFESLKHYDCIEYIYDPQNNIHKAICFPSWMGAGSTSAFIYDGDDYSQTTIQLESWHRRISSTEYVPAEQKVYFSYSDQISDGIGKLHVNTYDLGDINLSTSFAGDYSSDILVSDSKIFLAKKNSLVVVNRASPYNWFSYDYHEDLMIKLVASTTNLFAINHENCSLEVFELNGNFITDKILGGACLRGAYNPAYNKVFMYNPLFDDNFQRIYIKNLNNMTQEIIEIDEFGFGYVSGVISDILRDNIYVSVASNPFQNQGEIKIIDASNNAILPSGITLPENMVCRNIYMANDKLYCVLEHYTTENDHYSKVFIIDLADYTNTTLLSPSSLKWDGQLNA